LPVHHRRPIMRGLEGGWQALVHKGVDAAKARPKLDPDVATLQGLFSSDPPSQYKVWKPGDAVGDGGGRPAASTSATGIQQTAPALERYDGSDDQVTSFLEVAALVQRLEGSTSGGRLAAAVAVVAQYAEVLHSAALRKLAQADLSAPKLKTLLQQLTVVDPLRHNGIGTAAATVPRGKVAEAERSCWYFLQHERSIAPVHKAVVKVERSSNELAESVSRRASIAEEVAARTQLQKAIEQDVKSLSTLLSLARRGKDVSDIESAGEEQLTGANLISFAEAAESARAAHVELADLLEVALGKRYKALKDQRQKVAHLRSAMQVADRDLARKKVQASRATSGLEALRRKLSGIQTRCNATLGAAERRRHAGHMETRAIEMALKVASR